MIKWPFRKDSVREDAVAGLVLGVQSVPDGLATGLLAGISPLSGLYGYMFGTVAGAVATSSSFMAIQGTGAMAMILSDVPAVHTATDPSRALFTLSVLTGAIMLAAGLFKLGSILRFVSNAVMVGFINAIGVNIILGQLSNFTGYSASGANRIIRALQTVIHPAQLHLPTLAIGVGTIVLIVLSAWRGAVNQIAVTLGVSYGPAVIFAVGALFVLVVLLHYSTVISALTDRSVVLAQKIAILEQRLEQLENRKDSQN